MKIFGFIFCLLVSMNVLAQDIDTPKKYIVKTLNPPVSYEGKINSPLRIDVDGINLNTYNAPVYFVDESYIEDSTSFKKINPADIFSSTIVNPSDAVKLYDPAFKHGSIAITTKDYAQRLYQRKLSSFSKEYKAYIETYHDDNGLIYILVVNNKPNFLNENEIIKVLYDLPAVNIAAVIFTKKDTCCGTTRSVVITEK